MSHFEVEIKSLLGEKAQADALKEKMRSLDPNLKQIAENKQLNHYFTGGDVSALYQKVEHLYKGEEHAKLQKVIERGSNFSVRTRQRDDEVLLVVKAAIDAGDSANTVQRIEFEEPVAVSLTELDELVLSSGFSYQAKWSREREEYEYRDATVCIDKNAGYGYLAEFEKIVADESDVSKVHRELEALMAELGAVELSQDRLARMFEHYNQHWSDYYGTDKTFVIN
jgi:predicted adenylyl cyclase CyaB